VSYEAEWETRGWQSPPFSDWLDSAVQESSTTFFGRPAIYAGEGFSIPFMPALVRAFPDTQFVVTGVLGPDSNAHGPNEFLHLGMAKKLTACVRSCLVKSDIGCKCSEMVPFPVVLNM